MHFWLSIQQCHQHVRKAHNVKDPCENSCGNSTYFHMSGCNIYSPRFLPGMSFKWTASHWMVLFREWKARPQAGRRYLQSINLVKNWIQNITRALKLNGNCLMKKQTKIFFVHTVVVNLLSIISHAKNANKTTTSCHNSSVRTDNIIKTDQSRCLICMVTLTGSRD